VLAAATFTALAARRRLDAGPWAWLFAALNVTLLAASTTSAISVPAPPTRAETRPVEPTRPPAAPTSRWPATRRDDVVDTLHGVAIPDPYRWLEDAKQPDVQAWMQAQDALARGELARLPGRDALGARFRELYYIDWYSPPTERGKRWVFARQHLDKEKTVYYYYRDRKDGPEIAAPRWSYEAAGFTPLLVGVDAKVRASAWKGAFYVVTNDGAPRWRGFKVDPRKPARASWREIIPERPDATLDGLQVIGGRLVVPGWRRRA
jgi:protease II